MGKHTLYPSFTAKLSSYQTDALLIRVWDNKISLDRFLFMMNEAFFIVLLINTGGDVPGVLGLFIKMSWLELSSGLAY